MLRAAPGADFEAFVAGFATGLEETLGVRLRDGQGADTLARTTDDVVEDIPGAGVYRTTLTAPDEAGVYWLVWDDDDGTFQVEQLLVTSSTAEPSLPSGRDLCALEDVLRYAPGYSAGDDDATDATLAALIASVSVDTYQQTGREFTPRGENPQPRLFPVSSDAAISHYVEIDDAAELDTVEIADALGNVSATVDPGDVVELPRSRDSWDPITTISLPTTALTAGSLLKVTGTFGYPEIPANVREAAAKLVIVRYLTDVAARGTAFADAVTGDTEGAGEINIGGLFRSATETISRYPRLLVG